MMMRRMMMLTYIFIAFALLSLYSSRSCVSSAYIYTFISRCNRTFGDLCDRMPCACKRIYASPTKRPLCKYALCCSLVNLHKNESASIPVPRSFVYAYKIY